MRCRKTRSFFSAYLEEDLSTKKRTVVERHLQECKDCARAYQLFQQMPRLLRGLREEPKDDRFTREVLQRVEKLQPSSERAPALSWSALPLRPSFALALLVTILLGGALLLSTDALLKPDRITSDVALAEPEQSERVIPPPTSVRGQLEQEIQSTLKLLQAYQKEQSKPFYLGGGPSVDLVIDLGSLMRQDAMMRQRARSSDVTTANLKETY